MSSLYFHIPFCERKCIYCDFYSIETLDPLNAFLAALLREIELDAGKAGGAVFDTVYFGGGTPSLLTPRQLSDILDAATRRFDIAHEAEMTMEVNPGTASRSALREYRRLGINRLSIGIQSFHDDELRFLGRIHDSEEAVRCVDDARRAGFDNISIDLISALPGQTITRWNANLERAAALAPEHVSAYSLIVEDHTPLARMVQARQVSPAPPELDAALYEATMAFMEEHGYLHYEVSNYARPGFRSRHNDTYWHHGSYLGLGPSAHSFWMERGGKAGIRWANIAQVSGYCAKLRHGLLPIAFEERVPERGLLNERIFLGLRSDGLDLKRASRDFGIDLPLRYGPMLAELIRERIAVMERDTLRLTPKGFLICDEVSERLML